MTNKERDIWFLVRRALMFQDAERPAMDVDEMLEALQAVDLYFEERNIKE